MPSLIRVARALVGSVSVGLLAGCSADGPELDDSLFDNDVGESAEELALSGKESAQAFFNMPTEQNGYRSDALFEELGRLVDQTPTGATIRVAIVTIGGSNSVVEKLIAAFRRGVNVQIVSDRDAYSAAGGIVPTVLRPTLGTDLGKSSWIRACGAAADGTFNRSRASCNGASAKANNHNKFVLFSQAGSEKYVTWVGSTNLTSSQLRSWNNAVVFKNDPGVFKKFARVWRTFEQNIVNERTPARPNLANLAGGTARGTDVIFAPDDRPKDALERFLGAITCDKARGHFIKISMHEFSNSRNDLARTLARTGCQVELVGSYIGWKVRETFQATKSMHYTRFVNPDTANGYMNHNKFVVARADYTDGHVGKRSCTPSRPCKDVEMVFTGSHNWSDEGLSNNDESMVRISDDHGIFRSYVANFDALVAEAAKAPVRSLPRDDEWAWCTANAQCGSGACTRVVQNAPRDTRFCE